VISVPFRFAQPECQTCLQREHVSNQDFPPEVAKQGHLLFLSLFLDGTLLVSVEPSEKSGSVSESGTARGDIPGVRFIREVWSRLVFMLSVGVVTNVELTITFFLSPSLLDLLRNSLADSLASIGLMIELSFELFFEELETSLCFGVWSISSFFLLLMRDLESDKPLLTMLIEAGLCELDASWDTSTDESTSA
jgi:hypothetical protein